MSESPAPGQGPPSPTPPPTSPAPVDYGVKGNTTPYLGPAPDQDSKTMAMLAHLLGIVTGWVGPLVVWLIKKDQSPFVNDQGKEALNWEITVSIALLGLGIVHVIMYHIFFILGCLVGLLFFGIYVINIIFVIQGAMAANKGVAYRYPVSLRLIK